MLKYNNRPYILKFFKNYFNMEPRLIDLSISKILKLFFKSSKYAEIKNRMGDGRRRFGCEIL